jgi:ribonucleoside-triphosphate reductase (formate)
MLSHAPEIPQGASALFLSLGKRKINMLAQQKYRRPSYTPARNYDKGMGEAVANRTVNRKIDRYADRDVYVELKRHDDSALDDQVKAYCKSNNLKITGYTVLKGNDELVCITLHVCADVDIERWEDVAKRVAFGNAMLDPRNHWDRRKAGTSPDEPSPFVVECTAMEHHLRQASILMSGRHLQHGDENQIHRNMEVFTNCSTSATTFLGFYLLLNGSGVGRCYDDAMMQVDWNFMPTVVTVIDGMHKDVQSGEIKELDERSARHMYAGKTIHYFRVPDSREGWAQAYEKMETMAFAGCFRNDVLLLDFSDVRCRNSPIMGMQGRPASGPGPMMDAINKISKLRDAGMEPWRATMFADHYSAECVLVGGARRAARMATKFWKDKSIFGFIELKRGGFLWSSNNSVMVDLEFWNAVKFVSNVMTKEGLKIEDKGAFHNLIGMGVFNEIQIHAWKVFTAACEASYFDGTGEPGFITVERLTWNPEGSDNLLDGEFADSKKYSLSKDAKQLCRVLAQVWSRMQFKVITNPCGEIVLNLLGAYCVIADVVPFHAGYAIAKPGAHATPNDWIMYWYEVDADAEDAFKTATRALIRTNLMDSMYGKEVARTNRIGVGMTGIHEYAFARFGFGWKALVNEEESIDFWLMLSRFKRAVQKEATEYSKLLGVNVPHTDTTMKPAGTTSKLFGLTEGAHLPSMGEFLRWVQFRNDDPLIEVYRAQGYPIRKLQSYSGTTIVGFPTVPTICTLGMGDLLVCAGDATPEEQYQWLRLLEKYWIVGVEADGITPLRDTGNQVSYTLKYKPQVTSFPEFMTTLLDGQSSIRCCSVMPQSDTSAYEYLPEQPVTKAEFEMIVNAIKKDEEIQEDVGMEHVDCASGACPINFGGNVAQS